MGRGSKIFWVIVSILFAFCAIAVGSLYQAKKTKELNATISQNIETTETSEASSSGSSAASEEGSKEENKEENKDEANDSNDEVVEITSADGQNAQEFIDVIIVNGQVQGEFTLEEYYRAKEAVDALPAGAEKKTLEREIKQIETAMTNMGISY